VTGASAGRARPAVAWGPPCSEPTPFTGGVPRRQLAARGIKVAPGRRPIRRRRRALVNHPLACGHQTPTCGAGPASGLGVRIADLTQRWRIPVQSNRPRGAQRQMGSCLPPRSIKASRVPRIDVPIVALGLRATIRAHPATGCALWIGRNNGQASWKRPLGCRTCSSESCPLGATRPHRAAPRAGFPTRLRPPRSLPGGEPCGEAPQATARPRGRPG
jgi:hypothetical protein